MGRLTERAFFGTALAALGVGVLVMELVRYWLHGHPIHPTPVLIGCGISFCGAYMLDSQAAKDGGKVLVDSATKIIVAIRSGRRSTDNVAVMEVDAPAVPPAVVPAPQPGEEGGGPVG